MRIFNNCVEAINEITRDLFARGIIAFDPTFNSIKVKREEGWEMKELIAYTYTILNLDDKGLMITWAQQTYGNIDWLTVDFIEAYANEKLSGRYFNPTPSWLTTPLKDRLEESGMFSYTEEERMWPLARIINSLKRNPFMRGALLSVYESTRDASNMGLRRTPCVIGYHFIGRQEGDKLSLQTIHFMRSCNLIKSFCFDTYTAMRVHEYVATQAGFVVGPFTQFTGSLHAYQRDVPDNRKW